MKLVNSMARREVGLALAFILCAAVAVQGQRYWEFVRAGQANANGLRQYAWKTRTEVRKGGEVQSVQLHLVRHDAGGALQKTLIGGSEPRQIPTRGLRGFIARKKKEDFVEMLDGLGALARSYAALPPGAMQRFIAGAEVTPGAGPGLTLFRLHGRDVLRPGDSVTVWVDALTRRNRRVEVGTTFERQPVRVVSEFRDLPGGPTYLSLSVIDYPSRELVVTTENFDHSRQR
jgi:hypothetical protein